MFPLKNIRNFGIIAHVDHGKSTLSDRLMEFAGNISKKNKNEQVLDKLQVERERGITVKAQTVSLFHEYNGEMFLLNLIDTPGHVDFSSEVNRSLVACQGVVLLVDSNQLTSLFGFDKKDILKVSAKQGTGIVDVMNSVIEKIPPPKGNLNQHFRALQYDSWYSKKQGVTCLVLVVDGSIRVGDEITSSSSSTSYVIQELGILYPEEISVKKLFAGQAGYFKANIKNPKDTKVGDTWFKKGTTIEHLPMISQSKPMVFAGIFPSDRSKTEDLRKAIEKLILNDSSVNISMDTSPALGQGWRLGFLGVLHMEVFCQRLHNEFNADVIVTAPVRIKGKNNIKKYGSEEIIISNPSKFPDPAIVEEYLEPMVLGTIITPEEYYSPILNMCMSRRGEQKNITYVDKKAIVLTYKFPLGEIIMDFFNELKILSSGYASFDYEEIGYEPSLLKRYIVLFQISIQACTDGKKVVARENIKALRKDVAAKLYGGDVTRRMKLLQRQKKARRT
ncbi:translation factor GUF1 homolog, mitochondrial [Caerostris extrusa]|uniref:Translation factor GUF1 homolog, mitochondrial n=1 Tax=Caerostris extrusa TaxID=172846 RepID=A0AAV4UMI4_CAEEX|nr:translation factor GUF1 homolog, mitochondrial [Caerostris extrusa]